MRERIDFDLEDVQRAAQLRRLGRDLHDCAAASSGQTVDALASIVTRLETATEYGALVAEGFRQAMMADAAARHASRGSPSYTDSVPTSG